MTDIVVPTEQEGTKAVVKAWLKKARRYGARRRSGGRAGDQTRSAVERSRPQPSGVLGEILVRGWRRGRARHRAGTHRRTRRCAVRCRQARNSPLCLHRQAGLKSRYREANSDRRRGFLSPARPVSAGCWPIITSLPPTCPLVATGFPAKTFSPRRSAARASLRPALRASRSDSIRKRIAEHLAQSVRTAPHVTAMFEANFHRHRSRIDSAHKAAFEKDGANLYFHRLFRGENVCDEAMAPPDACTSTDAGMTTASRFRMTSISASAPRWATRA